MLVEQVWTGNDYRNFNYLIASPDTGEAVAIDPLEYKMCLDAAKEKGWQITQIINTHHHGDHIAGNPGMVAATGAKILAHENARDKIPNMDTGLNAGDTVKIGKSVVLEVLDTPGHTMSHVCLLSHTDTPALFAGDTMFNAGAGNCHNGGHPEALYTTCVEQLSKLPDETLIYPGHDYIKNNLEFTLDREPDNVFARQLLARVEHQDPANAMITNLGGEKEFNAFFRLRSPSVITRLRESFSDLPDQPDEMTVFLKLRELRNDW